MRIDWRTDKDAPNGRVIDLDTLQPISGTHGACFMVDEETGEWSRYRSRKSGFVLGPRLELNIEHGRGRVKFFSQDHTYAIIVNRPHLGTLAAKLKRMRLQEESRWRNLSTGAL